MASRCALERLPTSERQVLTTVTKDRSESRVLFWLDATPVEGVIDEEAPDDETAPVVVSEAVPPA